MQSSQKKKKKSKYREIEINNKKGELLLNLKKAMESNCTAKKGL